MVPHDYYQNLRWYLYSNLEYINEISKNFYIVSIVKLKKLGSHLAIY